MADGVRQRNEATSLEPALAFSFRLQPCRAPGAVEQALRAGSIEPAVLLLETEAPLEVRRSTEAPVACRADCPLFIWNASRSVVPLTWVRS